MLNKTNKNGKVLAFFYYLLYNITILYNGELL